MDRMLAIRMGRADLVNAQESGPVFANSDAVMRGAGAQLASMDEVSPSCGIGGLSILSVLVLGIMVFYIGTKGRQF